MARRLVERLKDWDYLRKWLVLGSVIGAIAGLAAIAFIFVLDASTRFLLVDIGGYLPPLPIGEGNRQAGGGFSRPWAIPLVVGLGGLISGVLVFRFAPEAEGHGTDSAIEAIHHNPRGIRPRVTLVKLLASAATIGSGGSAGREGPTAQISAGFGSLLARRLKLSPQDARIAVTVGVGAGIGAIFRAPLGGAVLGTEILYRDDLEPEALFPSLVASIVGFSIFGSVEGFTPIFGTLRTPQFDHPVQLLYYAVLGIVAGLVGRFYARGFYATTAIARRMKGPTMLKPAVAGIIVGLIGLALPQTLGTGYGWIQEGMRTGLPNTALWIILALPLVKIVTTSLSIGSGGSGGIFGPGMVIGGFVGLGIWRVLQNAPGMPHLPASFMVVGMIACFGSVAHAPLGLMLMVAEMTGSLALLPPAMIALGLAALVVGQDSIYESQLRTRADSPAHRAAFGLPMLGAVNVSEVMIPPLLVLASDLGVADAFQRLTDAGVSGAPVVRTDGRYAGVLSAADADPGDTRQTAAAADTSYPTVSIDANLEFALDTLVSAQLTWIPALDGERLAGIVAMNEIIGGYQKGLRRSLRLMPGSMSRSALVEATIGPNSAFTGRTVADAPWPSGTVALSIDRQSHLITPRSGTVLEAGDLVVAVVVEGKQDELLRRMGDPEPLHDT